MEKVWVVSIVSAGETLVTIVLGALREQMVDVVYRGALLGIPESSGAISHQGDRLGTPMRQASIGEEDVIE